MGSGGVVVVIGLFSLWFARFLVDICWVFFFFLIWVFGGQWAIVAWW